MFLLACLGKLNALKNVRMPSNIVCWAFDWYMLHQHLHDKKLVWESHNFIGVPSWIYLSNDKRTISFWQTMPISISIVFISHKSLIYSVGLKYTHQDNADSWHWDCYTTAKAKFQILTLHAYSHTCTYVIKQKMYWLVKSRHKPVK